MSSMTNDKSPNNFDFIRLVAASLVIWGHAYPLLNVPGVPGFMGASIHTFAVQVFFAVSGYLVVASWARDPSPWRFFVKRALRILPALAVVVAASALVLGPIVTTLTAREYFSSPVLIGYFNNLILKIHYSLPGVFVDNIFPHAVNGSLWTLPVEAAMYAIVLIAGWLCLLFSANHLKLLWLILTSAFLLVSALRVTAFPDLFQGVVVYATLVTASLDVASYFMVGGCLYLFSSAIPKSLALAGATVFLAFMFPHAHALMPVANILIVTYAVIVFGSCSTPVVCKAGRFGDLSYGVYLYGFPVAQTLSWMYGHDLSLASHILATLALSVLFAFASWHLVEKRALALKPGTLSKARHRQSPENAAEYNLRQGISQENS
jgi:peptidoglycan/LPS O-acetylase OafA/YrhL